MSSGLASGASGRSMYRRAHSTRSAHIAPATISGVSCSFRTCRSCQIIVSSSTVPIPPGTTTNASDTSTKWCSRVKKVPCSKACSTNAFTSCSNGSSTRMPSDASFPSGSASRAPSFAACISPGPPPVTISQPRRVSSAARSRTAA